MKTSDQIGVEIKSYRSRTLQGALLLVREELGPDASVLETREVWDGVFGQRQFEVLASDQVQVPSRFKDSMRADVAEEVAASVFDRPVGTDRFAPVSETSNEVPRVVLPVHEEDLRASLTQGLRESSEGWDSLLEEPFAGETFEYELTMDDVDDDTYVDNTDVDVAGKLIDEPALVDSVFAEDKVDDAVVADVEVGDAEVGDAELAEADSLPETEIIEAVAVDDFGEVLEENSAALLIDDDPEHVVAAAITEELTSAEESTSEEDTDADDEVEDDEDVIDDTPRLSPTLEAKLAELIDGNMDEPTARDLIEQVKTQIEDDGELGELDSKRAVRRRLLSVVENQLETREPISIENGDSKVIALIGPTGMGKTTTVAKLAAHFKLVKHAQVGLITVDTYRVAAVDQLRTYANIMELPLVVATTPAEMEEAIDELSECELILIDTAGCSPQDEERMEDLEQLLDAADPDDVQLVVGATLSRAAMQLATERFSEAGATAMVLTKLDEASGLGHLVRMSRDGGMPFTYVCEGQEVPNDIEPMNKTKLARRIVGSRRK